MGMYKYKKLGLYRSPMASGPPNWYAKRVIYLEFKMHKLINLIHLMTLQEQS